jgi:hypothetical protein
MRQLEIVWMLPSENVLMYARSAINGGTRHLNPFQRVLAFSPKLISGLDFRTALQRTWAASLGVELQAEFWLILRFFNALFQTKIILVATPIASTVIMKLADNSMLARSTSETFILSPSSSAT